MCFPAAVLSLLQAARQIVARHPRVWFYVSSNSDAVRLRFRASFPGRTLSFVEDAPRDWLPPTLMCAQDHDDAASSESIPVRGTPYVVYIAVCRVFCCERAFGIGRVKCV